MRLLSETQKTIERSFEKAVYDQLVLNGYLPNRLDYANDYAGYQAAKEAIALDKGFAVEVFGHGSARDREIKEVPRIVITGSGFLTGNVGDNFGGGTLVKQQDGTFRREAYQGVSSTYRIDVTLISQNSEQDRVLEAIRQAALPNLTFLSIYNDIENKFCIRYGFVKESDDNNHRIKQKAYIYEALDVVESGELIEGGNIASIKEINLELTSEENDTDTIRITVNDVINATIAVININLIEPQTLGPVNLVLDISTITTSVNDSEVSARVEVLAELSQISTQANDAILTNNIVIQLDVTSINIGSNDSELIYSAIINTELSSITTRSNDSILTNNVVIQTELSQVTTQSNDTSITVSVNIAAELSQIVIAGNNSTLNVQFRVIHFAVIGQSQAEGYDSTPALTTVTDSRALTLGPNSSGRLSDTTNGVLIELAEEDADVRLGETIGTAMAQQLLTYANDPSIKIIVTNHALGGTTIQQLSKGGSSGKYEEMIAAASRVKSLVDLAGDTYEVHLIFYHGGSGLNPYESTLDTLKADFRADVALLTTEPIRVFSDQQREIGNPDYSIQILDSYENDALAYLSHPRYMLSYRGDNVHLRNHGSRNAAVYFARAISKVFFGAGFDTLKLGNALSVNGNTIIIPIINTEGALQGSLDYSLEVYNITDSVSVAGTFAISGTDIIFTPTTPLFGTKSIEVRANQGATGELYSISSDISMFLDGSSQPYTLDKYLSRHSKSSVLEFANAPVVINTELVSILASAYNATVDSAILIEAEIISILTSAYDATLQAEVGYQAAKLDFSRTIAPVDSSWTAMAFHPHLNLGTSFPITDILGASTPWAYVPVSGWASIVGDSSADDAGTVTGNNSGIYPDSAMVGYHFSNNAVSVSKITGLDNNKTYTIRFFASRTGVTGRITEYDIYGQKVTIAVGNNTTNTVEINNISPTAGEIPITITDVGSQVYTYINVMEIIEEQPTTFTINTDLISITSGVNDSNLIPTIRIDSTVSSINIQSNDSGIGSQANNVFPYTFPFTLT